MAAQQAVDLFECWFAAIQQRHETFDPLARCFRRQIARAAVDRYGSFRCDVLPRDGNRTGDRHEPGRTVQSTGQVIGEQAQTSHAPSSLSDLTRNWIER